MHADHRGELRPNLPAGSSGYRLLVFNGSPAHVSAVSRPGTRPGVRPVIGGSRGRSRSCTPRFPAAFRRPALASRASFPARAPPLRPAAPVSGADPDRFSVFRTREMRLGRGALFIPGAAVPARPVAVPGRRLPHLSGQPLSPWTATRPGDVMITRHQQGFTVVHPLPAFPWPVTPDGTGPSGFSLSFTPG